MRRALAVTYDALVQCHGCGLLQRNPPLPAGGAVRCGTLLHRKISNELDRTLALVVTGLILFVIANSFPLLGSDHRNDPVYRGRGPIPAGHVGPGPGGFLDLHPGTRGCDWCCS